MRNDRSITTSEARAVSTGGGPVRESLFGNLRHRELRLEDGERVVMLRGARWSCVGWRSGQAHAGLWGTGTAYVLVPSPGCVKRRAAACLAFDPALRDRSSDLELLILGTVEQIGRLVERGPAFCRARLRRAFRPAANPETLARFRFKAASQVSLGASESTISTRAGMDAGAEREARAGERGAA